MSSNIVEPGPLFPELSDKQTLWLSGVIAAALVFPVCPWWAAAQLVGAYIISGFMDIVTEGKAPWWYTLLGGV